MLSNRYVPLGGEGWPITDVRESPKNRKSRNGRLAGSCIFMPERVGNVQKNWHTSDTARVDEVPRSFANRPLALDLFCGAGGASMGLHRAGFDVIGVDISPQPQYPFRFVQGDALRPPFDLSGFDFIWASPPCQAYTGMQRLNTRAPKRDHPKLVEPVREMLRASGVPYAIENVPGAPLIDPIILCGSMFGLKVRRHRLFECSFWMLEPKCQHDLEHEPTPVWGDGRPSRQEVRRARRARLSPIAVYGDHPQSPGDKTMRVNRARTLQEGQNAMGIDWMDWRPLTQAIPPAYSEFIGRAALAGSQSGTERNASAMKELPGSPSSKWLAASGLSRHGAAKGE